MTRFITKRSDIWSPRIVASTEGGGTDEIGVENRVKCSVFSECDTSCLLFAFREGSCSGDYLYWPFDTHKCEIHLGFMVNEIQSNAMVDAGWRMAPEICRNRKWKLTRFTRTFSPSTAHFDGMDYYMTNIVFTIRRISTLTASRFGSLACGKAPPFTLTHLNQFSSRF